ncbi:unnamed protein product [Phytomonas sp. EM1]|nr:unnamed protein product [Phytomonas sp. EM1]|eukprot:CCW63817.1 unnamed protein product [Phytomonas sp. isolate EM1]
MWRVCLSGVSFASFGISLVHTTRRWLWSCEESLRETKSLDSFLEELKRGAARDPRWVLDYSAIEELSGRIAPSELVPNVKISPLLSIQNALCLTVKHIDLSYLHITLSSPQSVRSAIALVRAGSLSATVDSIEIYIHTSALGECDWNSEEMSSHKGGSSGVAELFQALANSEGTHTPLQRLSIVMIDNVTGPPVLWNDELLSALSSLLACVQLTHVLLNYMSLQHCSESCLKKLVKSLANSSSTLRSLDLKAVPLLVKLVLESTMLRHCRALQCLDLSHNNLGDLCITQLVKDLSYGVGGWHQLHRLALAGCQVSAYSLELFSKALPSCKDEERTAEVEDSTRPVTRIEDFNLDANKLTEDAIFHLSTCLMRCTSLKQIDLRHNSISKRGIEQLLSSLTHATSLRCLRLRSNRLTDEGIQSLSKQIKRWQELEELDLTRCRLTTLSLVDLATAIRSLLQLRVLRMSGNDLRPIKTNGILLSQSQPDGANSREENELKLFAYDPSYMRPGSNSESGTSTHHDMRVPTSYEIERRDRERGRVRYRGTQEIDLEMIHKNSCEVEINPFQVFGAALRSCQGLRVLDLSDCSLQDESFAFIAPGLSLSLLEELHLSANPLFVRGGASLDGLVRALWCATATLRILDLSFLGLGDLGISTLCDGPLKEGGESELGVLGQLKKLEVLRLSHTNAGSLAIEAIRETVSELAQLQALFLDGNRCSSQDLVDLLSSLCCLEKLRFVALTGCVSNHNDREQVILSKGFQYLREIGVVVAI